jgi:hypothetical protein
MDLAHFILVSALLALGLYLFGHPRLASRQSRLVRGVAIWFVLVLALRGIDMLFLR